MFPPSIHPSIGRRRKKNSKCSEVKRLNKTFEFERIFRCCCFFEKRKEIVRFVCFVWFRFATTVFGAFLHTYGRIDRQTFASWQSLPISEVAMCHGNRWYVPTYNNVNVICQLQLSRHPTCYNATPQLQYDEYE